MSKDSGAEMFDAILGTVAFVMILGFMAWYAFVLAPAWSRAVDCAYQLIDECKPPQAGR